MDQISIPEAVLEGAAQVAKDYLKSLVEAERNVDGYTDNEEELAATNEVFDAMQVNVFVAENSIQCSVETPEMLWAEVMQEGTDPVAGGHNGMVTHPDGTQTPSEAPKQIWGTRLTWWKTTASNWYDNVMKKAQGTLPDVIKEYIMSCSDQLAEPVKQALMSRLRQAAGGADA